MTNNRILILWIVGVVFFLGVGILCEVYAIQNCGWNTLWLGKNAFLASVTGFCDAK